MTLAALVDAAAECGATAFAPAEGRTLIALGIRSDRTAGFRDRAAMLGFIVRPDDPRRAIVACPGAPACAAGLMPARAIAADVAAAAVPILDGSVTLHISGCAKGCAHPRPATLTFVGGEDRRRARRLGPRRGHCHRRSAAGRSARGRRAPRRRG